MTLTPFAALEAYTNLKLHFHSPTYDYFRYGGKSRLKESNFDSNPNKVFAQKLSKHKDCFDYILANVLTDPNIFIRDLAYDPGCEKVYKDWLKRQESLSYIFKEEVDKIRSISDAIHSGGSHPEIFKKYLSRELTFDTICLLCDLLHLVPYYDRKLGSDLIWQSEGAKIKKYIGFLPKDKSKFLAIIVAKLREKNDK